MIENNNEIITFTDSKGEIKLAISNEDIGSMSSNQDKKRIHWFKSDKKDWSYVDGKVKMRRVFDRILDLGIVDVNGIKYAIRQDQYGGVDSSVIYFLDKVE